MEIVANQCQPCLLRFKMMLGVDLSASPGKWHAKMGGRTDARTDARTHGRTPAPA